MSTKNIGKVVHPQTQINLQHRKETAAHHLVAAAHGGNGTAIGVIQQAVQGHPQPEKHRNQGSEK